MDKIHKYFIQYMLSHGSISICEALDYYKTISEDNRRNVTDLKVLVVEINRYITKQHFKIVFNTCEVGGRELVVWLNTKNDHISKLQLTFSPIELEYFHAVFQEIINSNQHRIKHIVCINISSTLTSPFSRDNGQKVLDKWLKSGYFVLAFDYVHLGIRTILEFTTYLRTHCPNSICSLCSELVFTSRYCCACRKCFHGYCIEKYLQTQGTCPSCRDEWVELELNENSQNGSQETMNTECVPQTSTNGLTITNDDSNDDSDGPRMTRRRRRI